MKKTIIYEEGDILVKVYHEPGDTRLAAAAFSYYIQHGTASMNLSLKDVMDLSSILQQHLDYGG
jgi:isocitrate dehydrogenase